jgi:hypothetical protein
LKDGPPEKKRRGRKTKREKEAEEAQEVEAQRVEREKKAKEAAPFVAELLAWPFSIVAERRGEFWNLSEQEKQRGAYALALLAEKYLPDFMRKYQEEILAAMVLGAIIGGRIREDRRRYPRVKRPRGDRSAAHGEDNASKEATDPAA